MDDPALPEDQLAPAHRDLNRIHRYLGNRSAILRRLRADPLPVRRVLDVGCGWGGMLLHVRESMGVEVAGVDLRPPRTQRVPIFRADAIRDPLPPADVAYSVTMAHHLDEEGVVAMIRNVGRSARRFILLDLVRHPLPLLLFRACVAPWLCALAAVDGQRSVRAAYTPGEMRRMAERALGGRGAFRHSIGPLYARQILDISYPNESAGRTGRSYITAATGPRRPDGLKIPPHNSHSGT